MRPAAVAMLGAPGSPRIPHLAASHVHPERPSSMPTCRRTLVCSVCVTCFCETNARPGMPAVRGHAAANQLGTPLLLHTFPRECQISEAVLKC